jgi:hypothetical protein
MSVLTTSLYQDLAHARAVYGPLTIDKVTARITAYLRTLGLEDEAVLQTTAARAISSALRPAEGDANALLEISLEHVMTSVDAWLTDLAAGAGPANLSLAKSQLACLLFPILRGRPEVFLQRHNLPDALIRVMRMAAAPACPAARYSTMPTQQFRFTPLFDFIPNRELPA